jgi:hypothetical protein
MAALSKCNFILELEIDERIRNPAMNRDEIEKNSIGGRFKRERSLFQHKQVISKDLDYLHKNEDP